MARISIDLPEHFPFSTEIVLYLSHMNYTGHLDNALLLTVVSEARVRYFQSLSYSEMDVEGVGIVVADAAVQYRSEAFQGEVMVVQMAAADFNKYGCDLLWRMDDKASNREVARGKTGIVFFDYGARKMAPLPENFRRRSLEDSVPGLNLRPITMVTFRDTPAGMEPTFRPTCAPIRTSTASTTTLHKEL